MPGTTQPCSGSRLGSGCPDPLWDLSPGALLSPEASRRNRARPRSGHPASSRSPSSLGFPGPSGVPWSQHQPENSVAGAGFSGHALPGLMSQVHLPCLETVWLWVPWGPGAVPGASRCPETPWVLGEGVGGGDRDEATRGTLGQGTVRGAAAALLSISPVGPEPKASPNRAHGNYDRLCTHPLSGKDCSAWFTLWRVW